MFIDNILLKKIKMLQTFCKDLFHLSGISFFEHSRITMDNKSILFNTDPDWIEHFLNNKYCRFSIKDYNNPIYLWPATKDFFKLDNQVLDMRVNFNFDYGISIIKKKQNYVDAFSFCSHYSNCGIINYYLNNLEVLEKFIMQYLQKFNCQVDQLLLNNPMPVLILSPQIDKSFNDVLNKDVPNNEFNLSITELKILELLVLGHTAKMTAKRLLISNRTVEKHFENIKKKLNVRHKSLLIKKFLMIKSFI
jgi:DNA-binding CsgD family transcriptional regulator